MDAIFIQSFDSEIKNKSLQDLLFRIFNKLKQKNTKIIVFLNFQSVTIIESLELPAGANIDIVYVDEEDTNNPTTRIFHFLINYKINEFKKILLLESDCFLIENFDEKIKQFESTVEKPWYIIGSTYYGLMPWMNDEQFGNERRNHMNGVSVYNRVESFLKFINYIFISNEMEQHKTNYDFTMHLYSSSFGIKEEYIDCPYILNISNPTHDIELTHHNIKPEAVIVHSKNKKYYI